MENKYLTLPNGRRLRIPDAAEEARINAGIALDTDTYEPGEAEFKQMKPVGRGRPVSANPKEHINLRLSPDVLAAFRATGKGWQTRIDETLRAALRAKDAS